MRARLFAITAVFTATLITPSHALAQTDLATVRHQFRDYALSEESGRGDRLLDDVELPKSKVADAQKLAASMLPDGSWPDVNYKSNARSSWGPGDHLTRLLSITVYAEWKSTPAPERARCLDAIHRGLAFWIPRDLQCPNWWYNQIGGPKLLGTIGLLLGDDLQPQEKDYINNTVLTRSKVGSMTGQNRVWLAANGVMRGLLLDDESLVDKASAVIWDELRVANQPKIEGIQADWSFHQHGPQLQFGNYGQAFAVEMSRWATVLRSTRFAMEPQKLSILRNYMLDGENWVVWNGQMDISSCGRQLFPHSPQSKARAIAAVMDTMTTADPDHAADYRAFIQRNSPGPSAANDLIGTRFFWRSDYLVHRQPHLFVTVRMNSSRTIGGEVVNSENLAGSLLGDGGTYVYQTGEEYADIFPVWDWRKIPGVTAQLSDDPTQWPKHGAPAGQDFVGGACDGNSAVAAMDFRHGDLTAKKTWLVVNDTLVCLGAGIHSPSPAITTLNQCLLNGPVKAGAQDHVADLPVGATALPDTQWIEHDHLRYTLLQPAQLMLETGPRTGNWHKVFNTPGAPQADVTKSLFTLCIAHPPNQTDSYAYAISPAGEDAQAQVLANDANLAAVRCGDSIGLVFWHPGKASLADSTVTVSDPCIAIATQADHHWQLWLADPTETLKQLTITFEGQQHILALPQGTHAGQTIELKD